MADNLRIYLAILGASLRGQLVYQRSFALELFGRFWVTGLELVGVFVLFGKVGTLGGFGRWDVVYLYGVTSMGLGLAELFTDGLNEMPELVRQGGLDGVLIRPFSPLLQVAARQCRPHQAGRVAQGALAVAVALGERGQGLGPLQAGMLGVNVATATAVYASIFVAEAATAVFTIQSAEAFNAFSYGGVQVSQYPLGVYRPWLQRLFLWVVPVGLAVYPPALVVLGVPDPLGLPAFVPYAAPLGCGLFAVAALRYWRFALDRYRGTGS